MPSQRKKRHGSSKKGRQQMRNMDKGKCRKAFLKCVKRTGKWRGKKASISDAR